MFISHGFSDGPVLINTEISDTGAPLVPTPAIEIATGATLSAKPKATFPATPTPLPKRADDDGDGRVDADFASNMGEDPTKTGINFAADGTTKLKDGGKTP